MGSFSCYVHSLHNIREKGGAYGSGAVHQEGVFSFMSYRCVFNSCTTAILFCLIFCVTGTRIVNLRWTRFEGQQNGLLEESSLSKMSLKLFFQCSQRSDVIAKATFIVMLTTLNFVLDLTHE